MLMISMRHTGREAYFSPTRAMLERWREGAKTLERIETYIPTTGTFAKAGGAEILRGTGVSAGMPGMLGITAVRGRMLGPTDVAPGAPPAIILTEQYWRRAYGGSESAIGSQCCWGKPLTRSSASGRRVRGSKCALMLPSSSAATLPPARRASRVDPALTLRAE